VKDQYRYFVKSNVEVPYLKRACEWPFSPTVLPSLLLRSRSCSAVFDSRSPLLYTAHPIFGPLDHSIFRTVGSHSRITFRRVIDDIMTMTLPLAALRRAIKDSSYQRLYHM